MTDDNSSGGGLHEAVKLNRQRLERRFTSTDRSRVRWLVECRDLGDAYAEDAGVYFVECVDDRAVDDVVERCTDTNPYERILGIFNLERPLAEQGGGLTRAQWLERE